VSAALLLCGACSGEAGSSKELDRPRGAIVVLLDTLRADRLSCAQHTRSTTPAIDALAAVGVHFETAVSSAPWTLPSVGALLAAREPGRAFEEERLTTRSAVVSFGLAGYHTAAFTEGAFVSRHFGMDAGFDEWTEEEGSVIVFEERPRAEHGIERTFDEARKWLREHGDEPFFLFIHTYEPHTPYNHFDFAPSPVPPRIGYGFGLEHLERLRSGELELTADERDYVDSLYDSDILSSDRHVGELVVFLQEEELWDETLLVVTSDHGEETGAHSSQFVFDQGHSLHDDLVRVPLVLRDPTADWPVRHVRSQVRLIDVLPTVAERLGVELPDDVDGKSLVPLLEGEESGHRLALLANTKRGPPRIGLRDGRFKLIVTTGLDAGDPVEMRPAPSAVQLYDLEQDPGERVNLAEALPQLVEELRSALERVQASPLGKGVDDAELRERLRSLGYTE
jgi:arylsulfatase A-like enzyme